MDSCRDERSFGVANCNRLQHLVLAGNDINIRLRRPEINEFRQSYLLSAFRYYLKDQEKSNNVGKVKRINKIIFSILIILPLLFSIGHYFVGAETINYYNPLIDTEYLENLPFQKINEIKTGMSKKEVINILGEHHSYNNNRWSYTSDGKAEIGDFAWFDYEIIFENGKVTEIIAV